MLAGGIAGLLLAIGMTVLLPRIGLAALCTLAGIALIFEGWGCVYLALASRRDNGGVGREATAEAGFSSARRAAT